MGSEETDEDAEHLVGEGAEDGGVDLPWAARRAAKARKSGL